jgi:hypothetical protein
MIEAFKNEMRSEAQEGTQRIKYNTHAHLGDLHMKNYSNNK